jgi:hypothetical protein
MIVLKRGICHCSLGTRTSTCAGIPLDQDHVSQFVSEVTRVLNKKNPNAFAFLDGADSGRLKKVQADAKIYWRSALLKLSDQFTDLDFKMIFIQRESQSSDYQFRGIYIGPKLNLRIED